MKKLFRLLVISLLLGFILAALGYYLTGDAPSPQLDDLRIVRFDIPQEENAYYWFNLAGEELDWPEDEEKEDRIHAILRGESWDEGLIEELLERNAGALQHLEKGLTCSRCQVPEVKGVEDLFPYLSLWRSLAWLRCLRAMSLLRQAHGKQALDELVGVVRFGHMIEGSKGSLIHYLVGTAIKAVALEKFIEMTAQTTLEPHVLTGYARDLGQYKANENGLQDVFRVEYMTMEKILDDIATGRYGIDDWMGGGESASRRGYTGHFFQPNKTKMILAQFYRTYIDNVPRSYADIDLSALPELPESGRFLQRTKLLLSGNAIGKILVATLLPAGERTLLVKCRENVRVGAVQLILALRAFELENGQLPDSLSELVPEYLEAVPRDDFDGRAMRYSREERIVYSVGEDLKDSGGSKGEDPWEMADPTFAIGL